MKKLVKWALALVLVSITFAAQAQTQSQLEKDLADLRAWMRSKANQGDSITRAEWPHIKREFNLRTENLERGSSKLSQQSKEEYSTLKSRYRSWEQQNEERYGQPLNREEAARWEKELAGTTNIQNLRANQMRDTFIYFMEGVRGQRSRWSLRDWDYAEHVYLKLSDRKQEVLGQMNNSDKMKVAALQVEFNTLRKSRDAKDLYENMREKR